MSAAVLNPRPGPRWIADLDLPPFASPIDGTAVPLDVTIERRRPEDLCRTGASRYGR